MLISRAKLIRGAVAGGAMVGAGLPALAYADADLGAFRPDVAADGPHPWIGAPPGGQAPLRFVVIGDNTGIAKPGVFDAAMRQISWLQSDFVLSVGDLIEGYTEDRAEIARHWEAIEAVSRQVRLPVPVHRRQPRRRQRRDAGRLARPPRPRPLQLHLQGRALHRAQHRRHADPDGAEGGGRLLRAGAPDAE